jgi:hypothetical protein
MSKLITNNIKLWNVDQFIESFSEPNFNIYYFFIGNPIPFVNDNLPPTLYDNIQTVLVDSYDNMLYGKRITSSDIIQLAPRYNWVSGTVYTKYSHDDDNLFDSNFYVLSNEGSSYSVFKCLDNNKGAASTYRPRFSETSAADDFYFTPTDGYQWKYMYSITTTQFNKFATASHIPVYVNSNVVSNAISGSIDNIEVSNRGSGYASYTNGYFQEVRVAGNQLTYAIDPVTASSNASFYINSAIKITNGAGAGQQKFITGYTVSGATRRVIIDSAFVVPPSTSSFYEITPLVQIIGDGTGAAARAIVNSVSNTIYSIEVTSRGEGYTYASVVITGNTGVINVATGTAITANTATGKVIVSPKNGHGSNAASEIGARYVGICTTFDSNLSGDKVVDKNDFRVAGIIKDPLFANVVLNISSGTGTFQDGEVVSQSLGSPVASIVIINPGSGYTSNADVTIFGTNSVPAVANASSNSSGRISQINISNTGQGYILPSATITSPAPRTFNGNTSVSNTNDFISISGNVFQNNDFVKYLVATGNTAVSGLANNTSYYIVQANSTGVKLSSTLNGSAINLTSGVSETGHSLTGNTATVVVVVDTVKTSNAYGIVFAANSSVVKLTNAYGFFITGNTSTNLLVGKASGFTAVCDSSTQPTTYFDQTYKVVGSLVSANGFVEDELVTQPGTNGNGYVYSSNSTVVRLVNKKGTINQSEAGGFQYYLNGSSGSPPAQFLVSGVVPSDLVRGTGEVIYIENFTPITKSSGQTEDIKLVLEF